jgi:hypothetical protein
MIVSTMAMGFALAVWDGDGSGALGGVLGWAAGGGAAVCGLGDSAFWSLHPVKIMTPRRRTTTSRLRLIIIPPCSKGFFII